MSGRLWLLLWVCVVIAFTLAPFDIAFSPQGFSDRVRQVFQPADSLNFLKDAAHVISFVVLGTLVASVYTTVPSKSGFLRFMVIGFIGCLFLEAAQLFLLGRHARIIDFLLNTSGFGLGLFGTSRTTIGRRAEEGLQDVLRRPCMEATILACAVTVWLGVGLTPLFGALRMSWDKSFPLLIGNEVGATRPWLGELQYVRIYAGALSPRAVSVLNGSSIESEMAGARQTADLLVGYDFKNDRGNELKPVGELQCRALGLRIPTEVEKSTSGINLTKPTTLRSSGPAATLTNRIASSGSFSIELVLRPGNLIQKGPARFVTVSSGVTERNFMLGQSATDVVFRVRNHLNGPNGSVFQLIATGLLDKSFEHILATYDHGVSTLYKDGTARATIDLREPIFYSHFDTGFAGKTALYSLAVITIALPANALLRRWTKPVTAHLVALTFTFFVCVSPYLIACSGIGGPWRLGIFTWVIGTLALIYPAGTFYTTRARTISAHNGRRHGKG